LRANVDLPQPDGPMSMTSDNSGIDIFIAWIDPTSD